MRKPIPRPWLCSVEAVQSVVFRGSSQAPTSKANAWSHRLLVLLLIQRVPVAHRDLWASHSFMSLLVL